MTNWEEVRSIRKLSRSFVRELGVLDSRFKPQKIPLSLCHALIELDERGALSQNELAEILRVDKSAMSRVLAQLFKKAWIEIKASPEDLRKKIVILTSAGRSRVKQLHLAADSQVQAALNTLTPKECKTVIQGLSLYTSALGKCHAKPND